MKRTLLLALGAVVFLAWLAGSSDDRPRGERTEAEQPAPARGRDGREEERAPRKRGSFVARGWVEDAGAGIAVVALSEKGELLTRTHTDAQSSFRLAGLPRGKVHVQAAPAPPLAGSAALVDTTTLTAHRIRLRIVPGHRFELRVQAARALALALANGTGWRMDGLEVQGSIQVDGVPAGPLVVLLRDGTGRHVWMSVASPSAEPHVVPWRRGDGATLRGRVSEAGASVRVTLGDAGSGMEAATRSGADGTFFIDGLLPQRALRIDVSADGHMPLRVELPEGLQPNESRTVDLLVRRAASLSGRVITKAGAPIAGATLAVGNARATSDEQGRFRLGGLPPGVQRVRTSAEGWCPLSRGGTDRAVGAGETEEVEIVMVAARIVRGTVVDGKGAAVADVRLQAYKRDARYVWYRSVTALSDEDGKFRIALRPRIAWTIEANDGMRSGIVHTSPLENEPITLRLESTGAIAGRLLDHAGQPLQGRTVKLTGSRRTVMTGDNGRFHFAELSPGFHTLSVAGDESAGGGAQVRAGEWSDGVVLRAQRAPLWIGRVVDARGNPVADTKFHATADDGKRWSGARTDALGRFRAPHGSGDGVHDIYVDNVWVAHRTLDLEFDQLVVPDLDRAVEILVRGAGGAPAAGAVITFRAYSGGEPNMRERVLERRHTTHDGRIRARFPDRAGRLEVRVTKPSDLEYETAWRNPDEPGAWEIRPHPVMSWGGRVVDEAGRPVEGIRVAIHTPKRERDGSYSLDTGYFFPWFHQRTGKDGKFRFDRLAAGAPFTVRAARHPDYAWTKPVAVRDFRDDLTLVVRTARAISGRVVGPQGEPIEGVTVKSKRPSQTVRTDFDGRFHIGSFTTGAVKLTLKASGDRSQPYKPASFELPTGTEDVELRLERGHWLEGEFVRPDGSRLTSGSAVVRANGKSVASASLKGRGIGARTPGRFLLGPLPEGRYELVLETSFRGWLEVFLVRPVSVTVPGPPARVPVHDRWTIKGVLRAPDGPQYEAGWFPDEVYESDTTPSILRIRPHDRTRVTADGQFEIEHVQGLSGTLYVYADDSPRYALLHVGRPVTASIFIRTTEGAWMAGRVKGGKLGLVFRQGKLTRHVRVADGKFRAGGFPPGTWTVTSTFGDDKNAVRVEAGDEKLELQFR